MQHPFFCKDEKNSIMQHQKNDFFLLFHENLLYFCPSVWLFGKKKQECVTISRPRQVPHDTFDGRHDCKN